MTTEELAIKLCDSFESKNWRVEFDEFLIKLIHIRPTIAFAQGFGKPEVNKDK